MRTTSWFLLGAAALVVAHVPYLIAPPEGPMLFWREALTAMVSHNLAAGDGTLLRQTVDHFNPVNRVFAGEFPAYNLFLALAEKLFGPAHNYGRYVSFASYLTGLTAFFAYLRGAGRPQREVALATLALALSSWYTHSTRIMPDMFATCTMLVGVWAGGRYLLGRGGANLVPFALAVTVASLSKLPMLMVLGLLFPVWLAAPRRERLVLVGAGAGAVLPALVWYFYWLPQLEEAGAHLLMYPTEVAEGFRQVFVEYWKDTKEQFSLHVFSGHALAFAMAAGLILMWWPARRFWAWALLATLPFLFALIGKAGVTFATHYYYLVPLVPVLAGLASLPLAAVPRPVAAAVLLVAAVESAHYLAVDNIYTPTSFLNVAATVDRLDPSGSPLAAASGFNPTLSYYSGRRLWGLQPYNLPDTTLLRNIYDEGARLLVVPKEQPLADTSRHELLEEDELFRYYQLEVAAE